MSEAAKTTQVAPGKTQEPMWIRAMDAAGRVLCGIRGHDMLMNFDEQRMRMRCSSCGFISPGWHIDGRMPRRRFDGDAKRHSLVKRQK